MSRINYTITKFANDPGITMIDTKGWSRLLDPSMISHCLASGRMLPLAQAILHHKDLVMPNNICRFLGNGTAESALHNCVDSNIELSDVVHYQPWLKARWGIHGTSRRNASKKMVGADELAPADRDYLAQVTAQDRIFFDLVTARIAASGGHSVQGSRLGA